MLPTITRERLLAAIQQFDSEQRDSTQWIGWENHQAHKWAIAHAGQHYPVKFVVALAANVGVHTFSGGEELNRRIARLGFTVVRLEGRAASPPPDPHRNNEQHRRIAELELQVITEQVRARLALAALAATAELAQHVEHCPVTPCACGYTRAEELAAEVVAIMADPAPTRAQLTEALMRLDDTSDIADRHPRLDLPTKPSDG